MCDPKQYDIIDFVSVQHHIEGAGGPISIENFRRHKNNLLDIEFVCSLNVCLSFYKQMSFIWCGASSYEPENVPISPWNHPGSCYCVHNILLSLTQWSRWSALLMTWRILTFYYYYSQLFISILELSQVIFLKVSSQKMSRAPAEQQPWTKFSISHSRTPF